MSEQKSYHIVGLQIENIKKLKAIDIKPTGEMVVLHGKNGAGKTSILDSILWALTGGKSIQSEPISHGHDEAKIILDMGDFKVVRIFKKTEHGETTTSIKVLDKSGAVHGRPQEFLSQRLGAISFDPIAFTNLKESDQVEQLKKISGLGDTLDSLEVEESAIFEQRRIANVDTKRLESAVQTQFSALPSTRPEAVDVSAMQAVVADYNKRSLIANLIDSHRQEYTRQNNEIADFRRQISQFEDQIQILYSRIQDREDIKAKMELGAANGKAELENLPNDDDYNLAQTAIQSAQAIATTIAAFDAVERTREQFKQAAAVSQGLDNQLNVIRGRIKATMEGAKMPVDGIIIKNGKFYFNDTPFAQCSNGDRIRIAVAIAMAANPQIRIIQIRDGSLLDTDNMALIEELAKTHNFQAWVERVSDNGETGFEITDGNVVNA